MQTGLNNSVNFTSLRLSNDPKTIKALGGLMETSGKNSPYERMEILNGMTDAINRIDAFSGDKKYILKATAAEDEFVKFSIVDKKVQKDEKGYVEMPVHLKRNVGNKTFQTSTKTKLGLIERFKEEGINFMIMNMISKGNSKK